MNKIYIENSDGSYTCNGLTFSAPKNNEPPNRFYVQMQEELASNIEIDGVLVTAFVDVYAGSDREAADIALNAANIERTWRNAELSKTDIDIYKAEDLGLDAAAYRAYRVALREYPQQLDFPNGTRPTLS